jgi:sterol desaturase/sphingolipid hydroxylase (fatty acid hydroxylase superfamily)
VEAWIADVAQLWLRRAATDTARYVVFAVATWAILWVALQIPLRGRKIREDAPPARQLILEFFVSLRSIAIFSTAAVTTILLDRLGFYPLSDAADHWGKLWLVDSLAIMILAHDAFYYWTHRGMHLARFFRTFHRRHHRSHNPSPFAAYSFDLREAALMVSFAVIWPMVFPTTWAAVGFFVLHQIFRNTILHCGYELMPATAEGRPMFDWVTTTTHHDQHHADARYNFGLYFTWWDRWMGTENPSYHAAFARAVRHEADPDLAEIEGLRA